MDKLLKWEENLKIFQQQIRRYLHLDEWKFKQNISDGEKFELDDSDWEVKKTTN
ncbi:MAG: hypothetical protein NC917_02740 [Candidatus Omnitrophica bacterium]|nr:hypothetical protein [Candidatus Omnitrophota bacterium]MCM8810547.1 hypothetical protein [Candidatus Omnitrophota bacterium]